MSNRPYSKGALRNAYRISGMDVKTVCWRSGILPQELVKVLRGKPEARLDVLLELLRHIGLRLMLETAKPETRALDPVPSVIDSVRSSIKSGHVARIRKQ